MTYIASTTRAYLDYILALIFYLRRLQMGLLLLLSAHTFPHSYWDYLTIRLCKCVHLLEFKWRIFCTCVDKQEYGDNHTESHSRSLVKSTCIVLQSSIWSNNLTATYKQAIWDYLLSYVTRQLAKIGILQMGKHYYFWSISL